MFAFHSRYLVPLEDLDRMLETHRAFIRSLIDEKKLICSGPKNPCNGGFILLNASDKDEALKIMAGNSLCNPQNRRI